MNKADLTNAVYERLDGDLTQKQAKAAVDAVIDTLIAALSEGDYVRLPGFGTFDLRDRAGRMARNPQTGEAVPVPARIVVRFKPGSELKAAVNIDLG